MKPTFDLPVAGKTDILRPLMKNATILAVALTACLFNSVCPAAPEPAKIDAKKLRIDYSEKSVMIGNLTYIAGKSTMKDVEAALGKPDRTLESNYVSYCYDELGIRFLHHADSKTKAVRVAIFMREEQTPDDILAIGKLPPGKTFQGVIRLRGLEFRAPLSAGDVYPKLNPLFPRSEAVPGNDRFGNTLYRYGGCETQFCFRKETGVVGWISLDRPRPE